MVIGAVGAAGPPPTPVPDATTECPPVVLPGGSVIWHVKAPVPSVWPVHSSAGLLSRVTVTSVFGAKPVP